jgi:very-short-patch-repair endonuclease
VLTRADLATLGVTRDQRRRLLGDGSILVLGQRTYRVGGAPASEKLLASAAALDAGGVLSHRSACWLHGIGRFGVGAPPEVLVAGGRSRYRGTSAIVRSTTWLPSDDVIAIDGIRATSVARTLFSLAAIEADVGPKVLRGLVDDAVRMGKASDRWLWWRLEKLRCRGRGGVRTFEAILADRSGGRATESWLEREFLEVLRSHGVLLPVCQRRVGRNGAFVARVDFIYPDHGIVVEVLGHTHHSSRAQLAADAARRNALQLAGLQVLEFVYDDVVAHPEEVAATVRRALDRSSPRSRAPGTTSR